MLSKLELISNLNLIAEKATSEMVNTIQNYHQTYIENKLAIEAVQKMCEESLSPDQYEQWETICEYLKMTRKDLKGMK